MTVYLNYLYTYFFHNDLETIFRLRSKPGQVSGKQASEHCTYTPFFVTARGQLAYFPVPGELLSTGATSDLRGYSTKSLLILTK